MYTGALKERWDKRNYKWSEVGYGSLPFDWSKPIKFETSTVKDQMTSGSCGGQACAYYGEMLNKIFDGQAEERSAKFIYAQTAEPGGGTMMTKLAKCVQDLGWGLESLTKSYMDDGKVTEEFMTRREDITQEAFKTAMNDRALSYAWVSNTNINTIAQAVRDNHGAILGINGTNNGTWLSQFPQPSVRGEWNHWLWCCGAEMIDGVKYLIVKNSWGNTVGKDGYQWLSEEFFTTGKCFSCVTFIYNPNTPTPSGHVFNIDLSYGEANNEVKELQDKLKLLGFFPKTVPSTGLYGDITKTAVSKFQYTYKVASSWTLWWNGGKYVGPSTRAKLNSL